MDSGSDAAPLSDSSGEDAAPANLYRAVLPGQIFSVADVPLEIFNDNTVLSPDPSSLAFTYATPLVGTTLADRWSVMPSASGVGTHALNLNVKEKGANVTSANTTIRVSAAGAGAGKSINLWLVGDSLTSAIVYPSELAKLLTGANNPTWKMLGTRVAGALWPGVIHEGHPGWSWDYFASHYEPATERSPLLFMGSDGKPRLDVGRYFDEQLAGARPDFAVFLLGTNDCFGANPDDFAAIDQCADKMLAAAEQVIASLRAAAPAVDIGLATPPPGNARQSAFEAHYGTEFTRWGWRRIQHRLVERYLQQFGSRESEHIYVVPTHLVVDPVDGYPVDNDVHPNAVGYKSIANTVYGWLKARLASP